MAEADITIGQRMDRAKHIATEFKESTAYNRYRPMSRQILNSEMRSDLNKEDNPLTKGKLCIMLKGKYRRITSSRFTELFIRNPFSSRCKWFARGFKTFIFEIRGRRQKY